MQTLRRCPTDDGVSMFVGTVRADGVPAGCRAIGAVSRDDLGTLTVYVPVATSRDVIAAVAATKRIAVVASYPPDHSTVQVKGTTTAVRLAADAEESVVRQKLERFADVLDTIGVPRRVTRAVACWPAFAIEMKIDEIFEQTPGPKAGTLIR
jgi:hypothetical protein